MRQWIQHLIWDWIVKLLRRDNLMETPPLLKAQVQPPHPTSILEGILSWPPGPPRLKLSLFSEPFLWPFPWCQGLRCHPLNPILWPLRLHVLSKCQLIWGEWKLLLRNEENHLPGTFSGCPNKRMRDNFSQDVLINWSSPEFHSHDLTGFSSGDLNLNSCTKLSIFQ